MTEFPFEKTNDQDILLANAKKAIAMCKVVDSSPGYGTRFFVPPGVDFNQMADREIWDLIFFVDLQACRLSHLLQVAFKR